MRKAWIGFVLVLILGAGLGFTPGGGADQVDFPAIYIDASVGDGGVGSQADPYNNLSDVNWTTGGDNSIFDYLAGTPSESPTIYLKKGGTWREQMTVGASGLAAYRNVITAYGTGADPIISGADLKTTPTDWMGYEHSDDFETGDTTKWDGVTTAGSNSLTIIEAAKYADTYGMRCTFDGTNKACNVGVSLGAASSDITVEFYMRLSADFTMDTTYNVQSICTLNHADIEINQGASGTFYIRGELRNPYVGILSGAISLNTWYKVKLRYVVHASTGGIQLWIDSLGGSGYESIGSDFARNTAGDTVATYYVGGINYGSSTIGANSDIDYDGVVITVGDGTNTNAYRSKTVGVGGVVIQDGLHLEPNVTSIASLTEGQYYTDGSNYAWVYPTGGGSPADYTMEMTARNHCIYADAKNYLTFQNLEVEGALWNGMYFNAIETLEVDSCTIKNMAHYGVTTAGESDNLSIHDCTFREIAARHVYIGGTDTAGKNTLLADDNTFTMDGEGFTCKDSSASAQSYAFWCDNAHGSQIYNNTFTYLNFFDDGVVFDNTNMNMISMQGCDGIAIYGNSITGGRHGMQLDTCIGVDIYRNRINKTRDDFIWLYLGCTGTNNIYYNVCSYSGDDGIVTQSPSNVYNNVVAYISDTGIIDFSTTDGTVLKNNIIYMWGTNSDDTTDGDRAFSMGDAHDFTADNNCWFSDEVEANQEWYDNPSTHNFAQWQAAGYDTNGLNTDPLMTDPASDDFTLQAGSPCIDAGVDVGLISDYLGNPISNVIISPIISIIKSVIKKTFLNPPDIGAYEFGYR